MKIYIVIQGVDSCCENYELIPVKACEDKDEAESYLKEHYDSLLKGFDYVYVRELEVLEKEQ